jgi:hypothetical protein
LPYLVLKAPSPNPFRSSLSPWTLWIPIVGLSGDRTRTSTECMSNPDQFSPVYFYHVLQPYSSMSLTRVTNSREVLYSGWADSNARCCELRKCILILFDAKFLHPLYMKLSTLSMESPSMGNCASLLLIVLAF